MSLKSMVGVVLSGLTFSSSVLAIAGIWGWIAGDTVWQLFATFFVVGLATIGLSYVTTAFFNDGK